MNDILEPAVTLIPTGGPLGAFVRGIDARKRQRSEAVLALKRGLLEHQILIFQNQDLSEGELLAFATHFGSVFTPPADVPVLASADNGKTPDVVWVANVPGGYTGHGELTPHSDHHWTPYPSAGSLLYALEVPNKGGDTVFYNMQLALETLDESTRKRIENLQLITYNPFLPPAEGERPLYRPENQPLVSPVFPHPLVRTHPESGRKVLYLDATTEVEVVGLSYREGVELVAQLRHHIAHAPIAYTHHWRVGDIVYWDNQAVLHARSAFDPNERRVLKRVSLAGSRPF